MEDNFDFDKVGKRMPYKVPPAFFDEITETTLEEAARRASVKQQTWKKLWPAMAVAASLVLLLTIGYFVYSGRTTNESMMATSEQKASPARQTENKVTPAEAERQELMRQDIAQTETEAAPGSRAAVTPAQPQQVAKRSTPETLDEVLASISDEELMLLAAVAETDLDVYEQTFE